MNNTQLRNLILDTTGCVDVDELGPGSFRVHIPNLRFAHETITLLVTSGNGSWTIDDLGTLDHDTPGDVDTVCDALTDAGAPFILDGNRVTYTVTNVEALGEVIASFGYYLSSAPAVWHALETAKTTTPRSPSATHRLAEETRNVLVQHFGDGRSSLFKLRREVKARGERVSMPLVVAPPKQRPWLAASCIDTYTARSAVQMAKASATFQWRVLADEPYPKFLVVRGESVDVEHLADLYDQDNVTVVEAQSLGVMVNSVEEVFVRRGIAA